MTWQIFHSHRGKAVPMPIHEHTGETESATIIAFLKARDKSAAWWSSQKEFSCRKVKK